MTPWFYKQCSALGLLAGMTLTTVPLFRESWPSLHTALGGIYCSRISNRWAGGGRLWVGFPYFIRWNLLGHSCCQRVVAFSSTLYRNFVGLYQHLVCISFIQTMSCEAAIASTGIRELPPSGTRLCDNTSEQHQPHPTTKQSIHPRNKSYEKTVSNKVLQYLLRKHCGKKAHPEKCALLLQESTPEKLERGIRWTKLHKTVCPENVMIKSRFRA